MGFQWVVRVSQRLQSRSLQSGAFRRFGLVQIVLQASKIRGVSQTLGRQSLYMTGAVAACFDGYGDGHYCKPYNYWRNGNVAVPGLFIYRRKAGLELLRVAESGGGII